MPLSIYQLSIPAFLCGLAIAGEYCRRLRHSAPNAEYLLAEKIGHRSPIPDFHDVRFGSIVLKKSSLALGPIF